MIHYRKGYKYQLAKDYKHNLIRAAYGIGEQIIESDYIEFGKFGVLTIKKGYAWDGPLGLTIDTKNFMRGSLVHDALYRLIREGKIPPKAKAEADIELWKICRDDGMSRIRSWYVWRAVHRFAADAADPKNRRRVIEI